MKHSFFKSSAVLALLLHLNFAIAAIPNNKFVAQDIYKVLNSNFENRQSIVLANPKHYKEELSKVAFDKDEHLSYRWRALTSLARIFKSDAKLHLAKAIDSSDWFMRDAALKAAVAIELPEANVWSRKLISDPSLVVRTSAVKNLSKLEDVNNRELLWGALNAKQNFKNGQSLWVRKHIVQSLANIEKKSANKEDIKKYIELLSDSDESLYQPAMQALYNITGKKIVQNTDSLEIKKLRWLSWWKEQSLIE